MRAPKTTGDGDEERAHPYRWDNAQVALGRVGNLDSLRFVLAERVPPGPGQVQIRARAIGLNFRDLMIAMGMYPPTPTVPSVMGSDYAGEVIACGAGVEQLVPGDRVMALSVGHVEQDGDVREASHFMATPNIWAFQATPIPARVSFVEAASIPTAFLTSYYGLHYIARLAAGERVLIHSATGGVGLAALSIARWKQAEIVATAGSEAKRAWLRGLGVAQTYDSRSATFADLIDGGVDVILNTLSGAAAIRGLEILRPFGRFLQIDKQDIAMNAALPLAPFRNGLTYTAIDLSMFLRQPEIMTALFEELAGLFAAGHLQPTPITAFAPERLNDALKLMSQYRHLGKIVIDFDVSA